MANIYLVENGRQKALLTVFNEHQVPLKPTFIDKFATDDELSIGEHRFLIAELKNEIGSVDAEPFFQAVLYFLESTQELALRHLNSNLPSIIVLIFGL